MRERYKALLRPEDECEVNAEREVGEGVAVITFIPGL